jgi:hypothetical protein
VESLPIIEYFNIVGNILFRFVLGRIDCAVNSLILEGCEKGFGQRIVITTPGAAQGLPHMQRGELCTEFR